ncbi:MAG TPA: hypothetical protein DCY59_07800 [Micrococcaceae bacterium]|nr:hypothetical protein [Micrococcaceae bacterium]
MMLDAKGSDWLAEKIRIKNLQWWDDVLGDLKSLGGPSVFHINPIGIISNFFSLNGGGSGGCIKESDALVLALRVSTGFEGRTELDYGALAGDFDGQGTSFGLIQWNFGQNTLGPLLSRMRQSDPSGFSACFPQEANYTVLSDALTNSDQGAQLRWARGIQRNDNRAWRTVFRKISENETFRKIQLSAATDDYKVFVHQSIRDLRAIAPELMKKVEVLTYVALYDLAVQQGGLRSRDTLGKIKARFLQEKPGSQKELLTIAVQERGLTASSRWVADATSRRMGIVTGRAHRVSFGGYTAERDNANFGLVSKDAANHVCDI